MKLNELTIYRNNDFISTLNIKYKNSNLPMNLTGCVLKYALSDMKNDNVLISKTITEHINESLGQTKLEFTKEELDIQPGSYKLEIRVIDSFNREITFYMNTITIKEVILYDRNTN